MPRLSLATPEKPAAPAKPGLGIKGAADVALKVGGKPAVKPASILRRRPALGLVAKVGIAFVVVAFAVGGIFSYRIFFPGPSREVKIAPPPLVKLGPKKDPNAAKDLEAKAAAEAAKAAEKAKADALIAAQEAPTPTPVPATVTVMAQSTISSDVKVNNTRIDAAPAASAAFRTFVASASIGGVFQGSPSRALINGVIVREGQTVESALDISFDRIDAAKKVIYFRDSTGAEVSKNY